MGMASSWMIRWIKAYNHSVVTRIVVFGIIVVMLGLFMRVVFLLPFLKEGLTALNASHQMAIADYIAGDISGKIRTRMDLLARLAAHLPPEMLNDPARLSAWVKERHDSYPVFSNGLVVVSGDGRGILAEYPPLDGRPNLDFTDAEWFQAIRHEHAPVMGTPMHGRLDGTPIVIMAAPVFAPDREIIAVLAGVSALGAPGFLDLLQNTRIGEAGGFLLISPRDKIFVAATDPAKTLAPLPKPGINLLHDQAMAGYRGTGITVNAQGVEEFSAITSVPGTGWFLVARIPTSEAFTVLEQVRTFILRNSLVVAVVVVVILLLVLPRFLRPLTDAARLIHRMAEGEIPLQQVPVVRHDEVGDLTRGFNVLLARFNDVTAQKVAEERLRVTERERMTQSLRQWMADTSHELRTPIAVLRAQIEALQDGVSSVDERSLGILHRETMGLSRLVDDLYTLARSDVGQLDCHFDLMAPISLLEDVICDFAPRYATAGLLVRWTRRPKTAPVISGDTERLRQVFANLMENTLRYTNAGGILEIACDVEQASLALHFDDTEPAVPDEMLPHVFTRFFRVDPSRSRAKGGAGIGLALCRSIIELHGGQIIARASVKGGLGITITLPCLTAGAP
ncbi:putative Histidine kinase [Candidatus Terasakiella magnetica]|nr:putative Histidine kinase [Candidatus Terasakiella magnetica]